MRHLQIATAYRWPTPILLLPAVPSEASQHLKGQAYHQLQQQTAGHQVAPQQAWHRLQPAGREQDDNTTIFRPSQKVLPHVWYLYVTILYQCVLLCDNDVTVFTAEDCSVGRGITPLWPQ